MIDILKGILNILTKKEVYGVIVTIAVSYFLYRTATIILNEIINYGQNHYERKKRRTVTNLFQNIIKYIILAPNKFNIRKIRFHDLRHTHATLLLYKGVDIKRDDYNWHLELSKGKITKHISKGKRTKETEWRRAGSSA